MFEISLYEFNYPDNNIKILKQQQKYTVQFVLTVPVG